MANYINIFLYTGGLDPDEVARRIAAAINATVVHHPGGMSVMNWPIANRPNSLVHVQLQKSIFLEEEPRQDHPSVFDLYDIDCEMFCVEQIAEEDFRGLSEEDQERGTGLLFNEITENEKLPWPAVLYDNGLLISAWAPAIGRTDFPHGTRADAEHIDLWTPYANPAAIARPHP